MFFLMAHNVDDIFFSKKMGNSISPITWACLPMPPSTISIEFSAGRTKARSAGQSQVQWGAVSRLKVSGKHFTPRHTLYKVCPLHSYKWSYSNRIGDIRWFFQETSSKSPKNQAYLRKLKWVSGVYKPYK